jgi:hypothetical protein
MIIVVRQSNKNREYKNTGEANSLKKPLIKIVYFDEESASDFLDISAGGKAVFTREKIRERSTNTYTKFGLMGTSEFNVGVSGDIGAGFNASSLGKTIINKRVSNTILTDYFYKILKDKKTRIKKLENLYVTAPKNSMAYMKMYTPYMLLLNIDDIPINLEKLDEVLTKAIGYYELVGKSKKSNEPNCVLRFNINAFRNNYGLIDLVRMNLVFYGVQVGEISEHDLSMKVEVSKDIPSEDPLTVLDIEDGKQEDNSQLKVYDVVLAGVEDDE